MSKTKALETLVIISIIGDVAARYMGLGASFALAITQGALGIMLFADLYKERRESK
ncbi:hypothetical protein [Selenomonas bovis]|uniref:hypothetical protein n=1 Tax=Selenomonas bovis TaxID=416586 RepID=UPI0018CC40E4|nr:hypothetical protein [Selenomonas bovis]